MLCISKAKVEAFKKALKNKKLDVFELMKMSTENRTAVFEKFAGKNAKDVNLLFEQKLILKNRMIGLRNWASKVGEIGRYDTAKKAELAKLMEEYKTKQMERIFSPKENEAFLADLAEQKLGTRITKEEAQLMFDSQVKAEKLFDEYDAETGEWSSEESAAEYGAVKRTAENYTNNLKAGQQSIKGMVKQYSQEIKQLWAEDKYGATKKVMNDAVTNTTRTLINTVASWDNSWLGRQGGITLIQSPKTWWSIARKSMADIYQTFKGANPLDVEMAGVYSDPDFINGNYDKAKISFGIEEEVPTKTLERIPVVGKVFKASDVSFVNSAIRAKRALFKIEKQVYEAMGIPLDAIALKDIGTRINAIAARGQTGMFLASKPAQLLLWAPKMLKADWDILTAHTFGFGLKTKTARVRAAKTITRVVAVSAGYVAIASAMGADIEKNPQSTDFLAIRKGNTHIKMPFSRGMTQIVTLFARLATQKYKTSAGVIKELNSGEYGSRSLFDVGIDFLVNKTTPPAGVVLSFFRGRDFSGKKPTLGGTAFGFLPISVQNFIGLKDDASGAAVFGAFADIFGISTNTYTQETDWGQSTSKEMTEFKAKVGDDAFQEANDKFNEQYSDWLVEMRTDDRFQSLTSDDKQLEIDKKKAEIKKTIIEVYSDYSWIDKAKAADTEEGIVNLAKTYIEAFKVDPMTALKTLFTEEQLRKVSGDAVIMERMGVATSQAIKRQGGANPTDKLDHTVPLELGGDNSKSNLKIVTEEEWKSYTPVENYLGKLLKAGKIKEKDAVTAIKDFKEGKITFEEIKAKYK